MKKIYALILIITITSAQLFAQAQVGIDCNQPIDGTTGAINQSATVPVIAGTCTPWVRVNFILGPWSSPHDQTLHNGKTWKQTYDEIINGFINQGIQVYALVGAQMVHQSIGDKMIAFPGTDSTGAEAWKAEYISNFVEVVDYFKDRVRVYESYNEPNNWDNGQTATVHPKWFAYLLQDIYLNVKYFNNHINDPNWQVTLVSGALFTFDNNTGAQYIHDTYTYGINELAWSWTHQQTGSYPLDGFGQHIYVAQGSSNATTVTNAMNTNLNDFWNNVTSFEGTTSKKIWISEFGWESGNVGQQGQADNLTTAFNLLKNDTRVALAIWFTLSDWPGVSWGIYQLGSFAQSEQKLAFNAFKAQVNCYATNLQASSDCSGNITFNWNNSGNNWILDVSTDANFGFYYNKNISNLSTTDGTGFLCDVGHAPCTPNTLNFQTGTTYYWRIWNGYTHTQGGSFTVPPCVLPTNMQAFANCSGAIAFNWTNTGNNWVLDISPDPNFSFYYNKNVSNSTTTTGPSGFNCDVGYAPCTPGTLTLQPGTTYYWRIWNGSTHTNGASFIIPQPASTPTISANGSTTFCQGDSVILNAGSGYATYSWSNNATTQAIKVNCSGNYSVTISNNSGCSASSSVVSVTVNQLPAQPTISQNSNTLTSSAATSYQWYLNGNAINGATQQNYSFTQTGNYSVTITDANNCKSSSTPITITTTAIQAPEPNENDTFSLYPNPNDGTFNIHLNKTYATASIKITDVQGHTIYKKTLSALTKTHSINLSESVANKTIAGIYFIQLQLDNKVISKKIIVQ